MPKSEGKKFEEDFQQSVPKDWFCYRLKDSAGSWSNTEVSRFTPKNSCDFFVFTGRTLFAIECKSLKGKSLPYSNIRDKQLKDLVEIDGRKPVNSYGVFVINFRDVNETYLIHSYIVNGLKLSGERKSLSLEECKKNGTLIPQTLKRVRYRYDLSVFNY